MNVKGSLLTGNLQFRRITAKMQKQFFCGDLIIYRKSNILS